MTKRFREYQWEGSGLSLLAFSIAAQPVAESQGTPSLTPELVSHVTSTARQVESPQKKAEVCVQTSALFLLTTFHRARDAAPSKDVRPHH